MSHPEGKTLAFTHLTNYAINKKNEKFSEEAHKKSFKSILQVISANKTFQILKKNGIDIEKLLEQIYDIIRKTLVSIEPKLSHLYRSCQPNDHEGRMCFELLG